MFVLGKKNATHRGRPRGAKTNASFNGLILNSMYYRGPVEYDCTCCTYHVDSSRLAYLLKSSLWIWVFSSQAMFHTQKKCLHFSGDADQVYCCWMYQNNWRWGQSEWLVRLTRAVVPSGPVQHLFQRCAAFSLQISRLDWRHEQRPL